MWRTSLRYLFVTSYCITLRIFNKNFSFITLSILNLPNCQVSVRSDFSVERYDFFSQYVLNYGKWQFCSKLFLKKFVILIMANLSRNYWYVMIAHRIDFQNQIMLTLKKSYRCRVLLFPKTLGTFLIFHS